MTAKVFMVSGPDRKQGIKRLLKQVDLDQHAEKSIAIKANYNSEDPFPASTHIDTLRHLVERLQDANVATMTLAERSGMGNTWGVLQVRGVMELAEERGFEVVVIDGLGRDGYVKLMPEDSHWKRGFLMAKAFVDAEVIVQTCCLKTHSYGGHFTLSLKNSVGMIAKHDPSDGYNYMRELHGSQYQRHMIAEVNSVYEPAFVLMDGLEAFVKGGPASGEEVSPNMLLLSEDRIAIDAVGVAILRHFGTTPHVSEGAILEQTQLARAVEMGLGIGSIEEIDIVTLDEDSDKLSEQIMPYLGSNS